MVRRAAIGAVLLSIAVAGFSGAVGCSGSATPTPVQVTGNQLSPDMLARTWPVSLATKAEQEKLLGSSEGWVSLIIKRNYATAVPQLGASGGLIAARGHADAAALYRQAALISAYSFVECYGATPDPHDPVGTAHLLTVSYALLGDLEKARAESKKLDGIDDPTQVWHAPWKAWLAQENPVWPPDLSSLPTGLPPVAVGGWPELTLPNYTLPEREGSTSTIEMADPGAMVALALWHDAAAHTAAGDQGAVVDTYLARYHFPVEPDVAGVVLPNEFLVGSDYLVPEDGPFMADLVGAKGPAAVAEWKDKSALAAIAAASTVDGKMSGEAAADFAANLRDQLVEAAKTRAATGEDDVAHRTFASIAEVGVLRTLPFVAEVETARNSEEGGKLRILAMEKSDDATSAPEGLLSLTAWDAGNRYTMRGAEIVHNASRRYPSVEAARYALDVLGIRIGRSQSSVNPNQ